MGNKLIAYVQELLISDANIIYFHYKKKNKILISVLQSETINCSGLSKLSSSLIQLN